MIKEHRLEVALVVLIVLTTAVFLRWNAIPTYWDRHIAGFEEEYRVEVGRPGPWFSAWSLGDGQAYAAIGIDPTGQTLAAVVDETGYRFARAGYGWAVWATSLGQATLVPYALAVVGALALLAALAVAIRVRPSLGPRAWLIVVNPALFIGFAHDTSEPMGIALLAAGFAGAAWWLSGILGVTRPTFLVALWGRWRQLALGAFTFVALSIYSTLAFGVDAMIPDGGRLGAPLYAYIVHPSVWGLLLGGIAVVTLLIGVKEKDWIWVLVGTFVLCFGTDVLRDPINAWRAAGLLPVVWAFGRGLSHREGLESLPAAVEPA